MAGEFLSCGRSIRAAILLGVAADAYSAAEFSCAASVWRIGLHRARQQDTALAPPSLFSYAWPVLIPGSRRNNSFVRVLFAFVALSIALAIAPLLLVAQSSD